MKKAKGRNLVKSNEKKPGEETRRRNQEKKPGEELQLVIYTCYMNLFSGGYLLFYLEFVSVVARRTLSISKHCYDL